jgi:hypothetical protein
MISGIPSKEGGCRSVVGNSATYVLVREVLAEYGDVSGKAGRKISRPSREIFKSSLGNPHGNPTSC